MTARKEVIVGISGGIAAYKAAELVRLLKQSSYEVTCALTEGATRFVTPLTFTALSGRPALTDVWEMSQQGRIEHVELGRRAELIVTAPATADHLAQLYGGGAHDPLAALVLASRCPVLLAPAMETAMWESPATQRNTRWLAEQGRFHFVGPESGGLASGHEGVGRMAEPAAILEVAHRLLAPQDFAEMRVVVTAGPTREPLDPVRFLSNRSSGKMGFALAERAARRGAKVTLIHGPVALTPPKTVKAVAVETAEQMLAALEAALSGTDALFMAAAVCDYRVESEADHKLKKDELGQRPKLSLVQTKDLLQAIGPKKGRTTFVGFAAETENLEVHARRKLAQKSLDLIVANDVSQPDVGFDSDFNRVDIYDANKRRREVGRLPKGEVADHILDEVLRWRREH